MVVGCASLALMRAARCPLAYGLCASDCSQSARAASALQRARLARAVERAIYSLTLHVPGLRAWQVWCLALPKLLGRRRRPQRIFLFIRVTGIAHPTHTRTACIRVIVHDRAVVGRDVHVVSFAPCAPARAHRFRRCG